MKQETWQALLSFESRDIISEWFKKIHSRELNARRANEIVFAAKQAREYFKNSHSSDNTVRPLLTFYGVASLSRALTLLLKRDGGEEGLAAGHGLETIGWKAHLSGAVEKGLQSLGGLTIKPCAGLFLDLERHTDNRIAVHINSQSVDWRLSYGPQTCTELAFSDVLQRIPDLRREHGVLELDVLYAHVNKLAHENSNSIIIACRASKPQLITDFYKSLGYDVVISENGFAMQAGLELFSRNPPQFIHTYLNKTFGAIPALHIAKPLPGNSRYSQICVTYIVSFVLGILVRYFPTQWVSLVQGSKGDALWPTLNQAQHVVEETFPELIIELVSDVLAHPNV